MNIIDLTYLFGTPKVPDQVLGIANHLATTYSSFYYHLDYLDRSQTTFIIAAVPTKYWVKNRRIKDSRHAAYMRPSQSLRLQITSDHIQYDSKRCYFKIELALPTCMETIEENLSQDLRNIPEPVDLRETLLKEFTKDQLDEIEGNIWVHP